jgi:hypothetical protein
MQTAKVTVRTSDLQIIQRSGVTPAEVIVLRKIHFHGANGEVISNVLVTGELTPEKASGEFTRLSARYGRKHVEPLFPGHAKNLPATFKDLNPPVTLIDEPLPVAPAPADLPEEAVEVPATVTVAGQPEPEPAVVEVKPAKPIKKASKLP